MELQEIERILKESLNVDEVYAQGENAHFGVIVVSDEISALSKLKTATNHLRAINALFPNWRNSRFNH